MHFNKVARPKTALRSVEPRWYELNAQIGQLVNQWSRRIDLSAYVGPDAGRGVAPALYDPVSMEIEVNTTVAFGENVLPIFIGDFTQRETHFEWAKAAGAVLHEAMHAQYTTLAMCKAHTVLDPGPNNWFTLMDEPRIEGLGVRQYPENREFLRACALGIVLGDKKDVETLTRTAAAVHLAVLSLGRVDAGVLEKKDVKRIRARILEVVPKDVLKQLRTIWREFLTLRADVQIERMYELAKEFDRIVQEQAKNDPPLPEGESSAFIDWLMDALNGDRIATEMSANDQAQDMRSEEAARREEQKRAEDRADQVQNEAISKETFKDSSGLARTSSESRLVRKRPPSADERAVAVKLSRALKNAKYRDRLVSRQNRAVPPGRLRVNAAMQATAQRKSGNQSRTEPWRKKVRTYVDDPNLTVGIMCDISGSMRNAMEPIAVSTWVVSDAARRIDATAAAVYYGYDIFAVLRPGERLPEVNIYSAPDGREAFDKGFRALDGGLNLLNGEGARLLVVCSDGQYGGTAQDGLPESEACRKWLRKCREMGVAVVWLDYKNSPTAASICAETGAVHVNVGASVTAAAEEIGRACVEALTKASR